MNLLNGRQAEVSYQFASGYDDRWVGYLVFDKTQCDDGQLRHRLVLDCGDASSVVLVVMNRSDKHLAFHGRVLATLEAAWVISNEVRDKAQGPRFVTSH